MSYLETLREIGGDAEQLELAYQKAVADGDAEAFAGAIEAMRSESGENPLYAAWHYRLVHAVTAVGQHAIAWVWAIPIGLLNGLLLWLLSDDQRFAIRITEPMTGYEVTLLPTVLLLAAPISAGAIALFLGAAGTRRRDRLIAIGIGLAAAVAYVLLLFSKTGPKVFQQQYLMLMVMQLALLAWAGVGFVVLGRRDQGESRFAFLYKSLEAAVVAGLFAVAGGIFTAITFGLFQALGIEPPEWAIRLFAAGGAGLIVVVAVAVVYDPRLEPARQAFDEGLSKLIALLMRLMLPAALAVLALYLALIPSRFHEPFDNRDVLVIYNGMLFAVVALLVGATPVSLRDVGRTLQQWLRRGILVLSALALLVSVYALAAIVYRTTVDHLTPNRLTFIGWNVINIGILAAIVIGQVRSGRDTWLPALHRTFSYATVPYVVWVAVTILVIPWLFGIDQGDVEALPDRVQTIVYEQPYPILLKCATSPHVYVLDEGTKHWVKDIATFEDRGFVWGDVRNVVCDDIAAIPDGAPIPPDAGVPPTLTPGVAGRPTSTPPVSYPAP